MKSDFDFLQKDLSLKIYRIFLRVGKEYGTNFKEYVYQRACEEELAAANIRFISKPKINLYSSAAKSKIGIFIPDLLIEDKIIIEIKVQKILSEDSIKQLI